MKKIWIIFSMLAVFGLSSYSQLQVGNKSGKDLYVSINGKEEFIPNTGAKTFASTRSAQNIWLNCRSVDGTAKFAGSKQVSRAGLVEILPSDISTTTTTAVNNLTTVSYITAPATNVSNSSSGTSLSNLLNSSATNSEANYTQSTTTTQMVSNPVSQPVKTSQPLINNELVKIEYTGSLNLKIVSSEGQGLELTAADSTKKYTIYAKKNADLVIGVVEKKGTNQAIWPYGEIRKRINSDAVCKITDTDIQMMSNSETKKLRFKVDAKDYKILIRPDASSLISLAYQGISKPVEFPIGQSYVRISYTDPQGVFHPTAFMSVHVTAQDRYILITTNDLAKVLTINNW